MAEFLKCTYEDQHVAICDTSTDLQVAAEARCRGSFVHHEAGEVQAQFSGNL